MTQEIQTLVEMGFSKEKAERAMEVTNNKGIEPAMEWLLAHADEDIPMQGGNTLGTAGGAQPSSAAEPSAEPVQDNQAEAKSLKCDECNKLFKNQDEVEFHAAKTGHSSFSESTEEKKPLTEEEKKQQLERLEERMKEKRRQREEKEKVEALEREKLRIRSGRDMQDARRRMQEQEVSKMLEQRRRDKLEETTARDRVRRQIEADKEARRLAAGVGQTGETSTPPPAPAAPAAPAAAPLLPKVSYEQTRIQLRLPDGTNITQTFSAKEQLSAVKLYLELNTSQVVAGGYKLMTSFPKKVFEEEDYHKPLDVLGLVPSAVIMVTKLR